MKDTALAYLLIAFTFGVVGLSGLASGRPTMLAFVILSGAFALFGYSDWRKQQKRKADPQSQD